MVTQIQLTSASFTRSPARIEGAEQSGHQVQTIRIADLDFPLLRSQVDYEKGHPVEAVLRCQSAMDWATHVVILYPLWLGSMPALLKALLEQMLRPGFAFSAAKLGRWPVKFLSYKSARIIVTMGMPDAEIPGRVNMSPVDARTTLEAADGVAAILVIWSECRATRVHREIPQVLFIMLGPGFVARIRVTRTHSCSPQAALP